MQHITPFVLHPFHEQDFTNHVQLSGTLVRSTTGLRISYALQGGLDEILLPLPDAPPQRRDKLWQTTCFEFFVGVRGLTQYREINLAPSEDWNFYSFAGYRQGMQEETAIAALPLTQQRQAALYQLMLDFPLAQIIAPDQPIEVAVTAILQGQNGERAFYALTHCGHQPDFHLRESFLLQL